jgi:hypothetical protein
MDNIREYEDEDEMEYFVNSKKQIDEFIYNYDYKKAFWLLILVLERLNDNEKTELIDYYSKNLVDYGIKNCINKQYMFCKSEKI